MISHLLRDAGVGGSTFRTIERWVSELALRAEAAQGASGLPVLLAWNVTLAFSY